MSEQDRKGGRGPHTAMFEGSEGRSPCSAALTVLPIETKKKDLVLRNNAYDIIPNHPARVLLVGQSKSGKTNLMLNLLTKNEFYKGYFKDVVIISPNLQTDESWEHYTEGLNKYQKQLLFEEYDEEAIDTIIDLQRKCVEKSGIENSSRMLFILDDVLEQKSLMNSRLIQTLMTAGRHINISVWIGTQAYKRIPKTWRMQASNIIIFNVSDTELKSLAEDYTPVWCDEKKFRKICKKLYKKKYTFVHINKQVSPELMMRENFDNIIVGQEL